MRRVLGRQLSLPVFVFVLALVAVAVPSSAVAANGTHVSGTIASNTTWTVAGSPYVLDGNVTVGAEATLTIQPGVVVKLNGQFRSLRVNGALNAIGTAESRITFTSIQDDSIGGDSGGDGPTVGAPGQWYDIYIPSNNALSELRYVDVRYGGYGSAPYAYAGISIYGSNTLVTIDEARITDNQRSGIKIDSGRAIVNSSTIAGNQNGISVLNGSLALGQRSVVRDNSNDGLYFNLVSYTGQPTTIMDSDITANGRFGINIGTTSVTAASFPYGHRNNIYGNANRQLTTNSTRNDVDWRGNYFGDDVYYWYAPSACRNTSPYSSGHLGFRSSGSTPPQGPIPHSSYAAGSTLCAYDRLKIGPGDFSPNYIDGSVQVPLGQTFTACGDGPHARNPSECLSDPVDTATGAFTHVVTDADLPGPGVGFAFTRSYNSLDLTDGDLGLGWTHSYAAALTIAPNGDVALRGEDGQQLEFVKQLDGSFLDPAGGLSTLASVTGEYELTRTDQTRYRFDAQGRLTSIVDRNGQGVTHAYGGDGKLASITDAAGRTVTIGRNGSGQISGIALPDGRSVGFGYTSGRLTSVTDLAGKVWNYAYESHGWLVTETDPNGHVTVRNVYNSDGRVIEQYDALDNKTTFGWDQPTQTASVTDARGNEWQDVYANNVIVSRMDAEGNATEFVHDADVNPNSVTAPDGSATTMTYDTRGNLLTATAPASLGSVQKTFTYDGGNNVTTVTDARGVVTTYAYDTAGNMTSAVQDGVTVATYTYDTAGQVLTFTDGRNNTTTYSYDTTGNLVSETDPLGNRTTYTYDVAGRRTSRVDPRGNVPGADPDDYRWTYTYDPVGRLLTEGDSLGNTITYTYDDAGNELTETDANNRTTNYAYDAVNRLTSVTAPDGGVTTYTYDSVGNKLTEVDARGKTTTYAYDANNRLASVTNPLGSTTTYFYDENGNQIKVVEPRGNVTGANPDDYATTYTYDAAGRMLTETNALGHTTSYEYDAVGNRASVTDANDHSTSYAYDGFNRLTAVTAPDDTATIYAYDASGNLLTRTDANSHTSTYTYDAANRRTSMTLPLGRQWTYTYDAAGNLVSTVDAMGNATPAPGDGTTSRTYDRAGRLTGIDYSDSTPDVSFTYDGVGNRLSLADGAGAQTSSYDPVNRVTQVTRGTDTFSYLYDLVGNVTRRTYPDGTIIDYAYDDDSRLATVTSSGQTTTYAYDPAGNLTETTLPTSNGYVEERIYDRSARLTRVRNVKGSEVLSDFTSTLDPVGNPIRIVRDGDVPGTTAYGYDSRDRLVEVCFETSCPGPSDTFIRWTYDPVGNRLTETRPGGTTVYAYNVADELTQAGSTAYAYDANGNQTAAGSSSFAYDIANRLISTTVGGTTTSYDYDGDGNRLQAAENGLATNYAWDPSHQVPELALERDAAGGLVRRYLYGHQRITLTTGDATSYYVYDGLGSVANVTSAQGVLQWTYEYEPFGTPRIELQTDPTAPSNPMRFTGQQLDTSGLYHLRARYHDPLTGRFLQLDPAVQAQDEPHVSAYVYVANRPTVMVDPSGMTYRPGDVGRSAAALTTSPASTRSSTGAAPQCIPICVIVPVIVIAGLGAAVAIVATNTNRYPDIKDYPVPQEAAEMLDWVASHAGDSKAGYVGGAHWQNRVRKLPPGTYKEYDIDRRPKPGKSRNKRRIVVDLTKRAGYYTRDHYETFAKMRWPR